MTDSPLSARSTSLRFNFADYISTSLRSDGRKLSRQSEKVVRARGQQAARLRPAKTSAIARDASHGQLTRMPPLPERRRLQDDRPRWRAEQTLSLALPRLR
jgi:hypothetical protein